MDTATETLGRRQDWEMVVIIEGHSYLQMPK